MKRPPSRAWRVKKLHQLAEAGERGVPVWEWRQSELTVPALIEEGLVVVVERVETVQYYVLAELVK